MLVHKKPSFYSLVDSSKPDILIATETWFDGQIHDAEYFNLDHFTVHRKDRCCGKGGGVIVAVNKEYVSTREEDLESTSTEMIWVKVVIKGSKSLHIGGCYRAKIGDEDTLDALDKALQRICGSSNNSVLLAGDFNLPGWDWKSNTLKANCAYPNLHYKFIDIIDDNNLTQIVDVPTRLDNTLDLIATNRPNQINRTHTLPGIGDHDIVYTELNIQPARRSQTPRVVPLYHKANWSGFCERISEVADNISQTEDTLPVEELWNLLKMKILEGIQAFIPHKTLKSKSSCPWINRDLKKKIRCKDRAYTRSKQSGKVEDEHKFKTLKKEVQQDLRKAYWDYVDEIVTPQETDSNDYSSMKRFWKFIKHKATDFTGVASLKVDGKLVNEPKAKAEALNCQFQSVFTCETTFDIPPPAVRVPSMPNIRITTSGVLKLLRNLNPSKASGPDELSPRVLKELSNVLADPLARLFRKSLASGLVPSDWKQANVIPAFKKGEKYLCSNYRPISLTCIASKLMEHIICSSVMAHAEEHKILYPLQHGFRRNRSCETQLLEMINDVVNNMQLGLQTDVCVLDFSKAFDKVGHSRLIEKLRWYGIDGDANRWIHSFLSNRSQSVLVDGSSSNSVPVISGVPQGSVLGPCLFLFYINDIAAGLNSTVRLFADDTMAYLVIKSEQDARQFQKDLDKLTEWEKTWMMEFHPQKCEVISITRKQQPIVYPYKLHGQLLKHVDVVKYLGVHISSDLRWNKHIDYMTAKANSTLGFIRRNININNPHVKERAYKSLVRPILEYSQTVWDPYTSGAVAKIESVQRRAARYTLNRYHKTSSVNAMLSELNWQTLAERRRVARLVMFYKIHFQFVAVSMPDTKVTCTTDKDRTYVSL